MIEILDLDQAVPMAVINMMTDELLREMTLEIADLARAEWIRLALEEFNTTAQDYAAGIQPVEFDGKAAVITLLGELPNLLENGMAAKDLHDTLLGPNVPVVPVGQRGKHARKGGGFYRAIPFRHTVGSRGAGFGKPFQKALGFKAAAALGRQVYEHAKKLSASKSSPYGGKVQWGERLKPGHAPKLKRHHKTDPYAGMVKLQKTYESATQNQYGTFRTISTGSPGWIRPATVGRKLAPQVAEYVQRIAPQSFEAYVQSLK